MAVRQSTINLHNSIKQDFNKLINVKEFGVSKYTVQYILNTLAEKYYKSPKTIENIVFERTALAKK
jgi:hypothetical protein